MDSRELESSSLHLQQIWQLTASFMLSIITQWLKYLGGGRTYLWTILQNTLGTNDFRMKTWIGRGGGEGLNDALVCRVPTLLPTTQLPTPNPCSLYLRPPTACTLYIVPPNACSLSIPPQLRAPYTIYFQLPTPNPCSLNMPLPTSSSQFLLLSCS